jgi:hypothetical protein
MTNFSLVGPDFSTHLVTVGATFSGLPFNAFGIPSVSMDGTYTPATSFVLGGVVDVNASIDGTQVAGPVTDLNLPTPLTFPDAFANATVPTDLIYEPANDIRVVLINQQDPAQHSCDTNTLPPAFNPNNFFVRVIWESHLPSRKHPDLCARQHQYDVRLRGRCVQLSGQPRLGPQCVTDSGAFGTIPLWYRVRAAGGLPARPHKALACRSRHWRGERGAKTEFALTVLATVTRRPTEDRIVADAGKKTMSGDTALPNSRI